MGEEPLPGGIDALAIAQVEVLARRAIAQGQQPLVRNGKHPQRQSIDHLRELLTGLVGSNPGAVVFDRTGDQTADGQQHVQVGLRQILLVQPIGHIQDTDDGICFFDPQGHGNKGIGSIVSVVRRRPGGRVAFLSHRMAEAPEPQDRLTGLGHFSGHPLSQGILICELMSSARTDETSMVKAVPSGFRNMIEQFSARGQSGSVQRRNAPIAQCPSCG